MKYYSVRDGRLVEYHEIRLMNPNTSFPEDLPADEVLESIGYVRVERMPDPEFDPKFQVLSEEFGFKVDGKWVYGRKVCHLSEDAIKRRNDLRWEQVRETRDSLLKESDWTMLLDSPANKSLWGDYRKKLRDIPQTFSDPDLVVFPDQPVS